MAHARTFVAIDLGATSGRLMLGRFAGGRLDIEEIHRFANQPVEYGGELHWDLPFAWREIRAGLRRLDAMDEVKVDSIGVDAWGVDYALLGERGNLLENPYHYRDSRTAGVMERVLDRVPARTIYEQTGIQFMPINTLYQLYAAQERTPRLLGAAKHLVTIPDLIDYWLCGAVACEYTNASTTQFLAHQTRSWATGLLAELGLPTHLLADIVAPGTTLGPLRDGIGSAACAHAVVVAPACHDTASAVASIRARGGTAFLSSGTWSLLGTEVSSAVVTGEARERNFTNEGGVCGTILLLKNLTGLWLLEGCVAKWTSEGRTWPWDELLEMARGAAAARSLIDPDHPSFVRPAEMTAAIDDYCRKTGQPAPRTPPEYVRAVLESLALKYRQVLEELESVTLTGFRKIRVVGGGSRNELLNRLTADITGRTVIAGPVEATSLGNIAMQMLTSGAVGSLDEARDIIEASHPPSVSEPRQDVNWDAAYALFRDLVRG
jgi:rhamnulokinase